MDVRGVLNATAFFNTILSAEELDQLASATRPVRFKRGQVLLRQRDLGTVMYVLVSGTVTVSVHAPGGDEAVATLEPGEVVGEMAVITGERRSATVTAKRKVTALEIDKAALAPLLAAEPKLAERFAEMVEQRHAELAAHDRGSQRWSGGAGDRRQLAARMTAYYSG
ncbi:MAG: cyclic nucleotide-binding domain-containing protein [Hyphomicrobiales bacterium]|nr:cyclic nucleotide-binding domain-containing protein [Hyphomicrobiales bacterium]